MRAHKLKVTVPEDHRLEVQAAEVIVLAGSSEGRSTGERPQDMLALVDELRTLVRTEEEERILDEFEKFRRSHPVDLMSLFRIFKPREKGKTLEEMEEAIREGAAEE